MLPGKRLSPGSEAAGSGGPGPPPCPPLRAGLALHCPASGHVPAAASSHGPAPFPGNFNGQPSDDNLMPNGTSAGTDPDRLGESWQIPNASDSGCTNSGSPGECDEDIAAEAQRPTSCGILTDPQGPFAACHGHVPPQEAFESCFYDLCGTGGDTGSLCFALQSYADRCAQAEITVIWRNSSFCRNGWSWAASGPPGHRPPGPLSGEVGGGWRPVRLEGHPLPSPARTLPHHKRGPQGSAE
ncbi:Zonadhesin [Varanus komodoensis]|nr:Zonadhesin [Varanus komodoensis]